MVDVGSAAAGVVAEHRHVDLRTGKLEVPVDELMAALRRKDRTEVGRVAEQVGAARLAQALRRSDAPGVLAALAGIAALPGRVRLIGPVTELLVTADAPLASAAAHTLGEILGSAASPGELDVWEIPGDLVESACVVLRGAATAPQNATTLRLAALDALGDAGEVCASTPGLIALLRDPTGAVRRATALVLRPKQVLATGGFASGIRDIDKAVASASVATVCELSAILAGSAAPKGGAREPIWELTRKEARRLVVATDTPVEDSVQMLDCLDPTLASDRRILDALRSRRRTPLGDRASDILDQAQGRARP